LKADSDRQDQNARKILETVTISSILTPLYYERSVAEPRAALAPALVSDKNFDATPAPAPMIQYNIATFLKTNMS
jgi:hypothetical protein